jgi:hypothetical protein
MMNPMSVDCKSDKTTNQSLLSFDVYCTHTGLDLWSASTSGYSFTCNVSLINASRLQLLSIFYFSCF